MDPRRRIIVAHTDNGTRQEIGDILANSGYKNTRLTSNLSDFLAGLRSARCVILGPAIELDTLKLARFIRSGQNGNDKNVPIIYIVEKHTPSLEFTARLHQVDVIIALDKLKSLPEVVIKIDERKRSILIADDEIDTCNLIQRLFRNEFEVVSAYNGIEAYSLFRKRHFDVSIIDLMLPGIDGETLLERLLEQSPQHTALVFTAHKDEEIALRLMRKGGFSYLSKPSNPAEIRSAIHDAMQRSVFLKFSNNIEEKRVAN